MVQWQQLHEPQLKAVLIKDKKNPAISNALEPIVTALEAKIDCNSNDSLFPDERPKANNRNNQALERKKSSTRQSKADS